MKFAIKIRSCQRGRNRNCNNPGLQILYDYIGVDIEAEELIKKNNREKPLKFDQDFLGWTGFEKNRGIFDLINRCLNTSSYLPDRILEYIEENK